MVHVHVHDSDGTHFFYFLIKHEQNYNKLNLFHYSVIKVANNTNNQMTNTLIVQFILKL